MPNLSKTCFCSGLQCLKRLYWQVFPPEDLPNDEEEFELILVHRRAKCSSSLTTRSSSSIRALFPALRNAVKRDR